MQLRACNRGQGRSDRERRGNHAIDLDAHELGCHQVFGCGTHRQPERRSSHEDGQQRQQQRPDDEADDVDARHGDRPEGRHATEEVGAWEGDLLGLARQSRGQQGSVLKDLADRKRGQQHGHVGRAADRPVGDPFHE